MRMTELITKKRNGLTLSGEELDFIVGGYVRGDIPDYQMSAWLMSVYFCGMSEEETAALTMAMAHSGDMVDLSDLPGIKVDKHSTGGVGDTTTLVVAPIVAACGGTVAKMSGRGLAYSGGTLDKLESVPGVSVACPIDRFKEIVRRIGLCVVGQTENLVPADKLMYALRDVTGTVDSVPLIASSIMSKKIAAGADAIVLDVKTGSGAFMSNLEDARALARTMVGIGKRVGRNTMAIITDMNQPLGRAIGNGLEMQEAIALLSGKIGKQDPLYTVCRLLAAGMLQAANIADSEEAAGAMFDRAVASGEGLKKLTQMLLALGGDADYIQNPDRLVRVKRTRDIAAAEGGYLSRINAANLGMAAQLLGAGREKKTDSIDPSVGIVMQKRRGDRVIKGEPLATMYLNDDSREREAAELIQNALSVAPEAPQPMPLVYDVIK